MAPQRRAHGLLHAVWVWMLAPQVHAYFMGDSKAVLSGCRDHWTLQDRAAMPRLSRLTVCVDVRVLSPGAWVAFSYRSARAPHPELGLEGDDGALYAWLLGVRHRFPRPLAPGRWQQVCLRRDGPGNTFSLHVDRVPVAQRTVIAKALTPSGSLVLGCRPGERPQRDGALGRIELYLFRVWSDLDDHALCEDGSVIGWDSDLWGVTSGRSRQRDDGLACGERFALPGEGIGVTSTLTNQQPPIDPAANTSEASDASTTASALKTTDYTSQPTPLNPSVTMATSTNVTPSTTVSTGSLATVEGVVTMLIPGPVPQAPPFGDSSTANQITGYKLTPPITAPPSFQIPRPIPVPLGSSVKCDITPFCTNDVAHYWMLISVEAETSGRAETDVIRWASAVFGCGSSTYPDQRAPQGPAQGDPRLVCQGDSPVQELQVSCEKEKRSRCADCSVLMRFSQPVPVCEIQYQMTVSFGKDLKICSAGHLERVGRGLCGEVAPSSGGFVRCSPFSSLADACQSDTPSNYTCSPLEPGSIRVALPERDLCSLRCGSPGLSARVLLGSSQVWMGGRDPCREQHPVLCDPSRTQALILTESCPIPPLMPHMTNQSMLLPSFLRDTNFTGFPELRAPPLNALSDQTPEQNTSLPESSSFTSLRTTASPDQVQSHNASQTATPNTAQTTGSTVTVVTTTAPDTTTTAPDTTTTAPDTTTTAPDTTTTAPDTTTTAPDTTTTAPDTTTTAPDTTTTAPDTTTTAPDTTTTAPDTTTTAPDTTTTAPDTTTALKDGATFQNTTVVPDAAMPHSTTETPSVSRAPTIRYDATTLAPVGRNTTAPPQSFSTVGNHTLPATMTKATQTLWNTTVLPTGINTTGIPGNGTVPVAMTSTNPPNLSTTTVVSIDTITTSTIPPVQSPLATTTLSSMTGSDQHSKNQSIHTPETAIPTNHTVATVTESLPLDTTVTNQSNMSASTTGNISLGATETSEHTKGQEEEAKELEIQSQKVSKLNSSQVEQLVARLERLLDGASVPLVVGRIAVRAISNLMEGHHLAISSSTNRLIHSVDQLALKLEVGAETLVLSASSLALAVRPLDGSRFPETSLSLTDPAHLQVSTADRSLPQRSEVDLASVYLPSSLLESLTPAERALATRVQFTFYTTPKLFQVHHPTPKLFQVHLPTPKLFQVHLPTPKLFQVHLPNPKLFQVHLPTPKLFQVHLPTPKLFQVHLPTPKLFQVHLPTPKLFQDVALGNGTLVSPVLGSSVTNLSITNLRENIQFSICSPHSTQANALPQCVFWDFRLNGGRGGWSPEGCSVLNVTDGKTTCSCNHLTSFAVLLDLSRRGVSDRQHGAILTFITYIGCGVSAVFLSITLLTYMCFRKLLRDIPSKILVQLCLSLLLLNLVFLLDGWLALYPAPGLCISTAFFLHYFLLTSFTWAGLEALHMYLSIVRVFTPYLSRYMLRFSLMGWGIPMTVVVVIISVDKDNYGLITYGKYSDGTTDDFCWLRNNIAFYIGVVAYFLVIFVLCLVVFTVVLAQLARIKRQNPHHQSPRRGLVTDLRSVAGLILLLGLTWGFALFAWGPLHLPFIYLFSIFNSLQ
ncbi:unnamed protein product, partial [Boreogadus saida]